MSSVTATSSRIVRRDGRGQAATPKLNLVSLMDIFTILVFFLMLNTGEVEVLQPDERVALPQSFATLRPDRSPVIKVSNDTLFFKEQAVAPIAKVEASDELIKPLLAALEAHQQRVEQGESGTDAPKNSVSIMGDESLPYNVLKKVLYTCAQAGFRDIALAVEYSTSGLADQAGQGVGA